MEKSRLKEKERKNGFFVAKERSDFLLKSGTLWKKSHFQKEEADFGKETDIFDKKSDFQNKKSAFPK